MLTTPLLAHLSKVTGKICAAHHSVPPSVPFGNISVLLLANLHQFPPVANSKNKLYNNISPEPLSQLGHSLFQQFEIVVKLKQQMQITDPIWDRILQCSWVGECTEDDISEIKCLVLSNPSCDIPDFAIQPWCDCVLVTPRNGIQVLWNEWMVKALHENTGQVHYIVTAHDTCNNHALTRTQQLAIAHLKLDKTNHLPNKIDLAIGMKAMVLSNIAPNADLANGSQGIISDIILHPDEILPSPITPTVHLQYPPAAMLFTPLDSHGIKLDSLPQGTIPILPLKGRSI